MMIRNRGYEFSYSYVLQAHGLEDSDVPVVQDIECSILAAIEGGGDLIMSSWHTCETAHCLAGWAIHLAGDAGEALEIRVGPELAGRLIWAKSTPGRPAPNFFSSDEVALEALRVRVFGSRLRPGD